MANRIHPRVDTRYSLTGHRRDHRYLLKKKKKITGLNNLKRILNESVFLFIVELTDGVLSSSSDLSNAVEITVLIKSFHFLSFSNFFVHFG